MALGLGIKIHADTSELIEAESRIEKFAEHFEHKFKHHLSKLAGASALAVGAVSLIESIFGKPEEIDKLMRKFELSAESVQLIQKYAKETGSTFEEVWEKAKKGAIDLDKVLKEMREKHPDIISGKNVAAINENREAAAGAWEAIKNGLINAVGGTIRAFEKVDAGKMADSMHAMSGFGGRNASQEEAYKETKIKSLGGSDFELGDLPDANLGEPGLMKVKRLTAINAKIEALKKQRQSIREEGQNELVGGQLTSRQAVGAYTSQSGAVISKHDEHSKLQESIDKSINDLTEEQKSINNGA